MGKRLVPQSTASEQAYGTPQWVFDYFHAKHDYIVDFAADARNTKCAAYINKEQNALTLDWHRILTGTQAGRPFSDGSGWCNPPFENARDFVRCAYNAAFHLDDETTCYTILCLANSIGTAWYRAVAPFCETEIICPRFSYVHPDPVRAAAEWAAKKPLERKPEDWKPAAPSSSMALHFYRRTVEDPTIGPFRHLRIRHITIEEPNE